MKKIRTTDAISCAGSQAKLALLLGTSRQYVHKFGDFVPPSYTEKLTATFEDLVAIEAPPRRSKHAPRPARRCSQAGLNLGQMIEDVLLSSVSFEQIVSATGYNKATLCFYIATSRISSAQFSQPQQKLIELHKKITAKECDK